MEKYVNAQNVLPEELVKEIQKYVNGKYVYIPQTTRKEWGCSTGIREELTTRNNDIFQKYTEGVKISQLAEIYSLSEDRIKSIIYERRME
ncbi:hypothetical protein DVH26_20360 [Paenibacillus sp. H1-7]|uniref:CD3324 family protein n=1 Tax=Paenibacillus sp. H1-7 TaxID=2282849 RepID=UPI001EF8C030|nr:CD3324 family protein [Paenibacillus sp. H1-7]ULL16589.1 hypothetical protein DVH26_20360 [Paenibacillus sp. H1-7]